MNTNRPPIPPYATGLGAKTCKRLDQLSASCYQTAFFRSVSYFGGFMGTYPRVSILSVRMCVPRNYGNYGIRDDALPLNCNYK